MPTNISPYSEEDIGTLETMWNDGASGTEIANALGRSRSSVMGRISRMGLQRGQTKQSAGKQGAAAKRASRRKTSVRHIPKPKATPREEAKREKLIRAASAIQVDRAGEPADALHVGLLDLPAHGCKWPTGHDGEQHLFCGCERVEGKSYCPVHMVRAHQ